jgi:hypothetical protein
MEVTIGLSRAHYEKLLHDVPPEAPGYAVIHRLPQLDRWADEKPFSMCVILECESLEEAIALLQTAKEHCSGAIPDILYALKAAGALHLISSTAP